MSKVFIINQSGHDFREAERYGKLIFLTEGKVNGRNLNRWFRSFLQIIKEEGFSPEDYIICTSLQVLNFILGFILGWLHTERINILYYHNGHYQELNYQFSQLLEKEER